MITDRSQDAAFARSQDAPDFTAEADDARRERWLRRNRAMIAEDRRIGAYPYDAGAEADWVCDTQGEDR